jgi:hypothetical protein
MHPTVNYLVLSLATSMFQDKDRVQKYSTEDLRRKLQKLYPGKGTRFIQKNFTHSEAI